MRKANFCIVALLGDVKYNVGALPLALVFYKAKVVVYNVPNNLLIWNKFGNFDGAAVNVFVVVLKLTELVGVAIDFFRPPSANIVNGVENFFGALVYRKRSAVILIHTSHSSRYMLTLWLQPVQQDN